MSWSTKTFFVYVGILLGVLVAVAAPARGNPFPPPAFDSAGDAILLIAAINLPVDLFIFSLLLYVVYLELGVEAGKVSPIRTRFVGRILLGGVFIAIVGAFIDFSFFCHEAGQSGYYFDIHFYAPFISSDSPALAMLLVFGSVYFASILVAGLNRVLSLVPSCAIGFFNMFSWIALSGADLDSGSMYVIALSFVLLAVLVLVALMRWHANQFPQKAAIHPATTS